MTIWLIAEDVSDVEIVRTILKARGIKIRVEARFAEGRVKTRRQGISVLAKNLEFLIKTAIRDKSPEDCIAVLHDADEFSQPDRKHYEHIAQICKQYEKYVSLVIARDEIESWLLADVGLCKWLGIKAKNSDGEKQPSKRLESELKKKNMKWQSKDRPKVLDHLDGTGDQHSPSMQVAVTHLARCI